MHVCSLTPTSKAADSPGRECPRCSRSLDTVEDIEVVCEITAHVVAALNNL